MHENNVINFKNELFTNLRTKYFIVNLQIRTSLKIYVGAFFFVEYCLINNLPLCPYLTKNNIVYFFLLLCELHYLEHSRILNSICLVSVLKAIYKPLNCIH